MLTVGMVAMDLPFNSPLPFLNLGLSSLFHCNVRIIEIYGRHLYHNRIDLYVCLTRVHCVLPSSGVDCSALALH